MESVITDAEKIEWLIAHMRTYQVKYTYMPARIMTIPEGTPSAGPHPSVKGMRKKFWGADALLVRQGQYVYKIADK